jgi:hypothetical protein
LASTAKTPTTRNRRMENMQVVFISIFATWILRCIEASSDHAKLI